jgi:hypothetical protein
LTTSSVKKFEVQKDIFLITLLINFKSKVKKPSKIALTTRVSKYSQLTLMMQTITTILSLQALIFSSIFNVKALSLGKLSFTTNSNNIDRRGVLVSIITCTSSCFIDPSITNAIEEQVSVPTSLSGVVKEYAYESRDRNKNKNALIRDDIW